MTSIENSAAHERAPEPQATEPSGGAESHKVHEPDPQVRVQKPRRAAPADAVRPTRAEVNLGNLRHNLRVIERALVPNPRTGKPAEVWGVLKADAYGHGAPAVARTLERAGISGLCVALLEEGVELRTAGIRIPILVMGGYYGRQLDGLLEMIANDLIPVVYDPGQIERMAQLSRLENRPPLRVHWKIDTGMGRLGSEPRELSAMLQAFLRFPEVRLEALMTHFACADAEDLEATEEQMRQFEALSLRVSELGLRPRVRHAGNSAALFRAPHTQLERVRPGVALFGVSPVSPAKAPIAQELRPVMRVRSEIVAMRTLEAGQRIGYGHTFQTKRESVIATVPMGYADGLSRKLSNRGHALVRGRRAPIVGTVSMDLTMIDVTEIRGARLGDEAVFLGPQEGPLGKDVISVNEVAEHAETISWEVMTSISRRVPRFYREP